MLSQDLYSVFTNERTATFQLPFLWFLVVVYMYRDGFKLSSAFPKIKYLFLAFSIQMMSYGGKRSLVNTIQIPYICFLDYSRTTGSK